jgi:hypothetical protein
LAILASVVIAVTFWLWWATTVHYCTTSLGESERPAIMCEKDALAIFLIEQKTWPYHDMPFAGYWDNYDNKLVSIVAEPYLRLALTMAMTYLVWFRVAIYVRKRNGREQTVTPKQEQQQ